MGAAFDVLKQALGSVLGFFYSFLEPIVWSDGAAYGIAIVFLTIFINLIVFPLTLKQTRATRAFSEIQPEIKRIQKEYKEDPQEMQKRLMEVQKSAGATPGGCLLPLLVQMPIWFALFRLLQTPFVTVEGSETELVEGGAHAIDPTSNLGLLILNGDPTFLGMELGTTPWEAAQLSLLTAVPYLIMMVVMVATQYVQQWHSTYGQERPSGQGAGAQQAITKIMPLFIGVISFNFPAGLVLYWMTSNLFRLGQQVLIFRIDGRPQTPGAAKQPEPDQDDGSGDGQARKPQQGASSKRRRRRRR